MFENPTRKVVISIVSVAVMSLAIAVQGIYPQCGVYLRRARTWSFPDTRIYLDHAHDMTGDGLPDLLVSQEGPGGLWTRTKILILPNLGNGNFGSSPWATIQAPSGVLNFKYYVANINGDNRADILAMMNDTSLPTSFMAFINNGNGTFTAGTYTNNIGYFPRIADINGDGYDDYLGYSGSALRYSLGNGSGGFAPPVTLFSEGADPGDFNGDGKIDLVDSRHLHLNNGNLTFGSIDIQSITNDQSLSAFADYNSDGKLDVMGSTTPGHTGFTILYSTGTSFTRTDVPVSGDATWRGTAIVGNWGGNSAPDLAFQSATLNKYAIFINDGTGNFTRSDYVGRLDAQATIDLKYVRGDFDNDGKIDLIQATSDGPNSRLMFRDVTSFTFLKQGCDRSGQSRIVDLDHSNTTDWSFWNPATGDWSSRTRPITGQQSIINETINWGLEAHGDIPTPGDFDGDGITDRAIFRNSDGYWYIRRSSDAVWFVLRFGLPGDNPVVGDYDGDTISDIAVFRPSDGNWYIWYMGTQTFGAAHWGADGDKPAPADYDGDLKTDLSIYRPSEGAWYYYKSTDGTFNVVQWGISTDRPIPADFDGDGNADIAVYRDSDHIAYILRSATSTPRYYQFGVSGDIVQIGDYDGDYVADLGVYRPSNRTWWITTFTFGVSQTYGVDGAIPTSSLVKTN